MKKSIAAAVFILTCIMLNAVNSAAQVASAKPRTIVMTDGEVNDQDSFIRLLLYANEFDIAGLVCSSSQWYYKGDGKDTAYQQYVAPEWPDIMIMYNADQFWCFAYSWPIGPEKRVV